MYKVTETSTHIFFLTGPFSNWHPSVFHGRLSPDGPVLRFTHGEQYMMAAKANLFGDQKTLDKIMAADNPRDQKALGRGVCGFTKEQWDRDAAPIWDADARDIMFRGLWYKQTFNEQYRTLLINSDPKTLVEGSAYDSIWGVGLAWDDPAILRPSNWKGSNWLGKAHMKVRPFASSLLKLREDDPESTFDPWKKEFVLA